MPFRSGVLMISALVALAALSLTFLPSATAQTETWYARDTDTGLTACSGFNKDLSQTAGSSALTQSLGDGALYCWFEPARSITIEAGDWTATFELTTAGVGGPETATLRIDITDSNGAVVENIATCTSPGNPSGEVTCSATNVAQKALNNQRIRISVQEDGASGRTISVSYNGAAGGSADTRLVHPAEAAADPCAAITVETSDPAGQLWFNATVEPDGQPWTTQENVSASYQLDVRPALNVTNDGTGTCDITIRLLANPPSGVTLKYSTSSTAPNPGTNTVPTDPTSVTVCAAVASGGLCQIWLWTDYKNAAGGTTSGTLRVESVAA